MHTTLFPLMMAMKFYVYSTVHNITNHLHSIIQGPWCAYVMDIPWNPHGFPWNYHSFDPMDPYTVSKITP